MSDKDFYKNAMDKIALHTMEEIDTKQIRQKKKNMHARHRKMAAAVALVILITGGTVYAAKIGIFDAIFQNTKQLYNQQETEVILTTEEEHIYAVDEDGNYMILNDDGTPLISKRLIRRQETKDIFILIRSVWMKKIIIPMNGWESLMKKI